MKEAPMKIRFAIIGFAFIGCAAPAASVEEEGSTSSNLEGNQLSPEQIAHEARAVGVPCGERLVTAVAVGLGESDGVVNATHPNTDGSVDRGVWQINSKAWPMYSESCVFDASCNAGAMAAISSNGASWQPWLAFTNGRYRQFLTQAQSATASECNGATTTTTTTDAKAQCDAIGYYGRCVGQTSIWSENGRCRVRDCASEGKACGLISDEIGLGCLGGTDGARVSDCSAYGAAGRCFGDTKVWVEQGQCRWATMPEECRNSGGF
jgi:hypothetical protein